MLHTFAAMFPLSPSRAQQSSMRALIGSLVDLYPCGECARHFALYVSAHPLPSVEAVSR